MNEWEQGTYHQYEKLQEDGKIKTIGVNFNDTDGKITGKYVFGVKAYFDENPEERIRLGWIKHIMHNMEKYLEYNKQTQYYIKSIKVIDAYTVEDEYHIMDKTEEMMRQAEESGGGSEWVSFGDGSILWEV